jgi:hypothetical protein
MIHLLLQNHLISAIRQVTVVALGGGPLRVLQGLVHAYAPCGGCILLKESAWPLRQQGGWQFCTCIAYTSVFRLSAAS